SVPPSSGGVLMLIVSFTLFDHPPVNPGFLYPADVVMDPAAENNSMIHPMRYSVLSVCSAVKPATAALSKKSSTTFVNALVHFVSIFLLFNNLFCNLHKIACCHRRNVVSQDFSTSFLFRISNSVSSTQGVRCLKPACVTGQEKYLLARSRFHANNAAGFSSHDML